MMKIEPINLQDAFDHIPEHWAPRLVAEMGNCEFKLVKIEGEFIWHVHPADKVFIVIDGVMGIEFRDRLVTLHSGEMLVVPKDIEHKPLSHGSCKIMLIEPKAQP